MAKAVELRVELLDLEPVVWRRIAVAEDMNLTALGAAILGAMGWKASHLYGFEIDGKRYDMRFDDGLDLDDSMEMDDVVVRDVFKPGVEAAFQYDFGDDWWHEVEFVGPYEGEMAAKVPVCLDGEGACPPEDSGGPFGYAHMMEVAADEDHPDHEEMAEWLEGFPAEPFDLKKANRNIKKVLKIYTT